MTNAGFGSNLTLNGTVECDASVMDGSSLQFGAVGAVSGIKNPVLLAKRLCEQQSIKFPYGRIPPRYMFCANLASCTSLYFTLLYFNCNSLCFASFLVGNGAHIWAHEMGIQTLPPEQLISSMYDYSVAVFLNFWYKPESLSNILLMHFSESPENL